MSPETITKEKIIMMATIKTAEYLVIANKHFGKEFDFPTIDFSLRGSCSGSMQTTGREFKNPYMKLNKAYFVENWDDMINKTIPHEIAHYVADKMFKTRCHHDWRWKSIMVNVFKLSPERCHNYDTPSKDCQKQVK